MPQIIINIPTGCIYDAFGRMQQITYPDGEIVNYHYSNGLLRSVDGSASAPYIQSIDYDEYDAPIYIQYGNGMTSDIAYDDVRRWTVARSLRDENNDYMQDISYHYDNVGNITQIEQDAPPYDNMGGEYVVTYTYDDQYRLVDAAQRNSSVGDYDYTMAYSPSGVVDTKYSPETGTDITFGYTQGYNNSAFHTHRPQMAYSSTKEDIMMFRWDMNGQLTHIGRPYTEQFRRHVWNEAGQLTAVFGNEYCGYYAYDANGNRAYKLTGSVVVDQYNGGYIYASAYFDDATMYVNPYMVVTRRGYTKHYYNGSQRIASRLGDYWGDGNTMVRNDDLIALLDTTKSLWNDITYVWEPSHQDMQDDEQFIDVAGNSLPIHRYGPYIGEIGSHLYDADIFSYVFWGDFHITDDTGGDGVFFYHSDHLGSANWITNSQGQAVQYIHYMPFGELWENQQSSTYDERFKFTGKERDTETGYDYFGARHYLSLLGIWLSPDKKSDEYPHISSYAYCNWNPTKYIDPDGNEFINKLATPMQIRKSTLLSETQKSDMIQTNTNLNTNLMKRNAIGIDNVFELFAHGSPQSVMNKLTRITDANQLNSILCASSPYLNSDNNNSSIFIFYACNTGAGENSIAQQFSSVKEVAGSVVIAPTGAVSLDNNGMEYVKNGGEWRVFVDGVQVDAISGEKGMMTKYVKENMSDIDSFLKNCRQKILDGN